MPDYLFVCVRGGVDSDHDRPFVCLCRGGVDFFFNFPTLLSYLILTNITILDFHSFFFQ